MSTIFRSFIFGIASLLLVSAAKAEPLPLGATLDVHSISVARALPPSTDGFQMMCRQPEGTVVTLLVQVPHFSIIELDDKASRLSKFIDNKNNDLLKPVPRNGTPVRGMAEPIQATFLPVPAPDAGAILGSMIPIAQGGLPSTLPSTLPSDHSPVATSTAPAPFTKIDLLPLITATPARIIERTTETDEEWEEMIKTMEMESMNFTTPSLRTQMIEHTAGRWILIDCLAAHRPAPGTQLVTLEGQLVLHCGQEIKTTEHKNIPLDGTGKFEMNGLTVTVKKEERGHGFGDSIGDMFAGMFGVERKEIKMRVSLTTSERPRNVISHTFLAAHGKEIEQGSQSATWSDQIHIAYFDLTEKVDSLTIQLEAYEKIETVTLPLSLNTGLGF